MSKKRDDCSITFDEPSLTQQHFKDECDINNIMRRFKQTGIAPQLDTTQFFYGDFDEFDFHAAQNTLIEAEDRFMMLPAETRKRFGNDPGALLSFVHDEKNYNEAVSLGLIPPKPDLGQKVGPGPVDDGSAQSST